MPKKAQRDLAVAIACVMVGDSVLLVRRHEPSHPDLHNMWELPGGKPQKGETLWDTAVREVYEETGYLTAIRTKFPIPYTTHWDRGTHILTTTVYWFEGELTSSIPSHTELDPKVAEVSWKQVHEIPFHQTLPGSRDIIWQICTRRGISLSFKPEPPARILFERVDPSVNASKYYWLEFAISPGASEPYIVTRHWGRYHAQTFREVRTFQNYFDCRDYILAKAKERISHKYNIVDVGDFPPLRTWLTRQKHKLAKTAAPALPL